MATTLIVMYDISQTIARRDVIRVHSSLLQSADREVVHITVATSDMIFLTLLWQKCIILYMTKKWNLTLGLYLEKWMGKKTNFLLNLESRLQKHKEASNNVIIKKEIGFPSLSPTWIRLQQYFTDYCLDEVLRQVFLGSWALKDYGFPNLQNRSDSNEA